MDLLSLTGFVHLRDLPLADVSNFVRAPRMEPTSARHIRRVGYVFIQDDSFLLGGVLAGNRREECLGVGGIRRFERLLGRVVLDDLADQRAAKLQETEDEVVDKIE